MSYIFLLIGFYMLIKGADAFVDSASSIAKKFGIPSIVIGMTIVAMGTSAPELSVSITSSLAGMNDMSIANVIGSNIFNILVVLGVCALFNKQTFTNYNDVWKLLFISMALFLFCTNGAISSIEGIGLLIMFGIYMYPMFKQKDTTQEQETYNNRPMFLSIILGIAGLLGIIAGGNFVVDAASEIAISLGMSENLVGLTIVAVGTSLPELVTSVIATRKGETDIAIGNVIGSCIFNILLILGCAATISPMIVSAVTFMDVILMLVILMAFILLTAKKQCVNKISGLIMIIMYVSYIAYTIVR